MQISKCHWQQVEHYLKSDNRAILPLGCTEQHAYLSLSTDSLLAGKLAEDVGERESIPVFPTVEYGLTPSFTSFPGTVSLSTATYVTVIKEILQSLLRQGFHRILIVNGHGGNAPARAVIAEALADYPLARVIWHDWWIGPKTWQKVQEIDGDASHASWMENFPWTRVAGAPSPAEKKPMIDIQQTRQLGPHSLKDAIGDGNYGGLYQRPDSDMQQIWEVAVSETCELVRSGWA